jgi:hypothetical protein
MGASSFFMDKTIHPKNGVPERLILRLAGNRAAGPVGDPAAGNALAADIRTRCAQLAFYQKTASISRGKSVDVPQFRGSFLFLHLVRKSNQALMSVMYATRSLMIATDLADLRTSHNVMVRTARATISITATPIQKNGNICSAIHFTFPEKREGSRATETSARLPLPS